MSSFTRPLNVEQLDEDSFRLKSSFIYWIGDEFSGDFVYCPVGHTTDGASRPWWAFFLVRRYGNNFQRATLHDLLYRFQFIYRIVDDAGTVIRVEISRKQGDQIMRESGYVWKATRPKPEKGFFGKVKSVFKKAWNPISIESAHLGLRIGGWACYKEPQKWEYDEINDVFGIMDALNDKDKAVILERYAR